MHPLKLGILAPGLNTFTGILKYQDTLIKTTSLSTARSCIKDIIIASLKLAENASDSGQCGREAGCQGYAGCVIPHYVEDRPHCFVIPCQHTPFSL